MEVVIRSYDDVSYYVGEARRRWVYGNLNIHCQKITFIEVCKNPSDQIIDVLIPFQSVEKIYKATTTLIYRAVVVTLKTGKTFWFSSFKDHESVFKLLNYFHKNLVLDREKRAITGSDVGISKRTEMGTKLLNITHDSMATLSGAAVSLNEQGEKIGNSAIRMLDIHNDLDIAQHITSGLEKWVGRWSLPKEYKVIKPVVIKGNDIPEIYDYEILFTKIEPGKMCQQQEGVIQVSQVKLSVLDLKQKVLHQFDWSDVSTVRVISPWEMMVIRNQIGKPDISYSFVSSRLVDILSKIDVYAKHKMDYESPNLSPTSPESSQIQTKSFPVDTHLQNKSKRERISIPDDDADITFGSTSRDHTMKSQDEVYMQQEVVSTAEVEELSSNLQNLKSMMLAVGEETDIQNENLDSLTESVDQANIKLRDVNKRINKLM
ncbi:synaptosomal-associated protein 47 [Patella vulgata]|uniref:synaptosomal-associated protein 47 n=1 Tax=Patella vulgata TaxID=6465 RepID=UPI0024A9B04D|nr:synaptosomal-associated protein 47 [Patella vulgata]